MFRRALLLNKVLVQNYCSKPEALRTAIQVLNRDGDGGTSKTLSGQVLPKDHKIINAIGATEELLSVLGLAREHGVEYEHAYTDQLKRIQTVVIDISTAISRLGNSDGKKIPANHTDELEEWIKSYSKELPQPENYILPGGGVASASLQVARSVCRRTERLIVPLVRDDGLDNGALVYLNRLADFLFTISRVATKTDKRTESIYIPSQPEKIQDQ